MLKRVITALVALVILIPILIFSHTWVMPAAVVIVSLIAVFEALRCIGLHKNVAVSLPLYALAAWIPVSARVLGTEATLRHFVPLVAVLLLALMAIAVFAKGRVTVTELALAFMVTLYIVLGFSSIIFLRDVASIGSYLYLLVFIGAWVTDIMAYFVGVLFGKHKLIPEVSPKKTIEGSVGGTAFCALAFLGYGLLLQSFDKLAVANLPLLILCGAVIAVVAQIGDLSMSFLKRHYQIKDFGNVFPGHGGMLDRFDSVLAVSSLLFFAITYFNVFEVL